MAEPTIHCPNCRTEIKLTESLAAPLIDATRRHYEQQLERGKAEAAQREAAMREREAELARRQEALDEQVAAKLVAEREKIAAQEGQKARLLVDGEMKERARELADLRDVLAQRDQKLAEAQRQQAELMRQSRELEDAKRELDLTVEKRVQDSLVAVRGQARKDAEDALGLKVREKEEQISSMQRQIEELRRKAEQGSQQLQGEVQELALEDILRDRFPRDTIAPVPKGEFGGDLVHQVCGPTGQPCGTILWEVKRTKNWSDIWLQKLRNDQRAAKAEIAVIVSRTLPRDMEASFDLLGGVWVTDPRCAVAVAVALRETLIGLTAARQAGEGQITKMEMVYQYLTGPRFRHRIEAIVEKFTEMREDLDRERRVMTKLWAKREEQIRGVVEATAGMYGDLQGIAGASLQEIEALDVPLLDGPEAEKKRA